MSEKNTSDDLSPTFDLCDFTKKKVHFGGNLDETDVESDVDSLCEDFRPDHKSLRSDYGDPFAPVHDSATLQRLLEKSRKDDTQEGFSWPRSQQSLELLNQSGSHEDNHTNDNSGDWNKTLALQKSFISSENHFENKFCKNLYQLENSNHGQPSVSAYFQTKNSDLKNPTVKHFFQVQKESDHKQFSVKYNFNQKNNLASNIPHCMAVAEPTEEYQAEKVPSRITYKAHPSHKHSVIFDKSPSPQQIEQFKKNMFQNSVFSQATQAVNNPKSSDLEGHLPRLSHLLFDRKHSPRTPLNNFQTASSLISPTPTSYHSLSQGKNVKHYKMKTNFNHEQTSSIPTKSKLVSDEGNVTPFNLWPTSLQNRLPMNLTQQEFLNFTAQQNRLVQPLIVQERHYYNISACNHDSNNQSVKPDRNSDLE